MKKNKQKHLKFDSDCDSASESGSDSETGEYQRDYQGGRGRRPPW